MKKPYQKPVLIYESFELSTNIAAGCEVISNAEWMSCPILVEEFFNRTVFVDPGICEYSSPDAKDKICYHSPTDDNNVFSS